MPEDTPPPGLTPTNYQRTTGGNLQWKPPTPEHLSAMLPQYEIEALIGHGGMGAVYKGRQKSLDRTVAIKILPPEAAGDEDAQFVERFKNEARTMAKMNHPGIVHVYDFGETSEGQLYIVMEFIDGTDVSKMILSQGKLPPEHALAITAHVCDALYYAHKQNVIHRDIKPANIMINMEGTVKVADFGLAKANDPTQSGLTKTNMAMGTPDFVAPEALTPGMTVDGRADLYAVGVMLYQMLTGSVPRGLWTMPSVMLKTDPRFDAIISRSMQTDREARYQSAVEIRRDLDVILTTPQAKEEPKPVNVAMQNVAQGVGKAPPDRRPGVAQPARPAHAQPAGRANATPGLQGPKSKTPLLIGLGAAAALALGAFFMSRGSHQTSEEPSPASTAPLSQAPVKAPEKPAPSQPKPTPKPAKSPAVATPSPPIDALVFAGHRYQLVTERLIWAKAKEKAKEMGGHLAVIDTKEKLDWVWDTFGSKLEKTADKASYNMFIGLQVPLGEDAWEWVTGSPLKVQSWMGQLPEIKEGTGYVATIQSHSFDYVRPRVFPPAPFLVEWDDDGTQKPAVTATPTPAKSASIPPGWTDLLATADVARDAILGQWAMTAEGLHCAHGGSMDYFQLNYTPPEEYDFQIEFTVFNKDIGNGRTHDSVSQMIVVPGHRFALLMNSTGSYLGAVLDGKEFRAPDRTEALSHEAKYETARRMSAKVEVRRGKVRALINDKEAISWSGDFKRLKLHTKYSERDMTRLAVACQNAEVVFHRLMVRAAGAESAKPATPQSESLPKSVNPAAPTAPVSRLDRRRSADLIALVDVQRDVVSDPTTGANVWKSQNSVLTFNDVEKAGRLAAPVSLGGARAFEIELVWKRPVKPIPGTQTSDSGSIALEVPIGVGRWVRVEVGKTGNKVMVGGKRVGYFTISRNKDPQRIVVRWQDEMLSVKINGDDIGSFSGLTGRAEQDLSVHSIFKSELLPAVYCAPGEHGITEWTVRALDGEVWLLWEPSLLQDAHIAQLESGYQARYESDAQKPHDAALAALNQSYVANGISRVRAAAQAKSNPLEVAALDAERAAIERGAGVPAEDTAETPESLKTLRTTYRSAVAKITAERDAKSASLLDIYLKSLDDYIAQLIKDGKIKEAKGAQAMRDAKAAMRPTSDAVGNKTR